MQPAPNFTQRLIAEGKIVEAGWIGLRIAAVPADAPQVQVDEMRNAFFAGAHHLFTSIMVALDPGTEETAADLQRLDLIHTELETFISAYAVKHNLVESH